MTSIARRKRLKRVEQAGHVRFLTFSCYHRLPLFENDQVKDCFVDRLDWVAEHLPVQLAGWVVMPDHVHLLWLPDISKTTTATLLMTLKRRVARRVLARWRELDAGVLNQLADSSGRSHFWQPGGGYDRNILTQEEFEEKLQYIHHNPVERGLVKLATDWKWSSARWYAGMDEAGPRITPLG